MSFHLLALPEGAALLVPKISQLTNELIEITFVVVVWPESLSIARIVITTESLFSAIVNNGNTLVCVCTHVYTMLCVYKYKLKKLTIYTYLTAYLGKYDVS